MLVTLFTDASYDSNLIVSGWGAWARSERMEKGHTYGGWTTDPRVRGSTQAELYGALQAVTVGLSQELIHSGDTVLIQCDNMSVGTMVDFISFPGDACGDLLKAWMKQLIRERRLTFRYRHIEGHKNPKASTRHGVNNAVDLRAKQGLAAARKFVATGKVHPLSNQTVS